MMRIGAKQHGTSRHGVWQCACRTDLGSGELYSVIELLLALDVHDA